MKKRLIPLLATIITLICLCTLTATATEDTNVASITKNGEITEYTTLEEALADAASGDTIVMDDTYTIAADTTLTIPEGVTLNISGGVLYLYGTLKNNGTIDNNYMLVDYGTMTGSGTQDVQAKVPFSTGTLYASLGTVLYQMDAGKTVTLLKDVSCSDTITISKNLTLDLNGHTLSGTDASKVLLSIRSAATLTVTGNGTITSGGTVCDIFQGHLVVENGVIETTGKAKILIAVYGYKEDWADFSTVHIKKDATVKVNVSVIGNDFSGYGFGVFSNVSNSGAAYGAVLTIDGTIDATVNGCPIYINGTIQKTSGNVPQVSFGPDAELTGNNYFAGFARLDINGLEFVSGLEAKAGIYNISGGVFQGGAEQNHQYNDGGSSTYGYALAVVDNDNYAGATVNISGGTFNGNILFADDDNANQNVDETDRTPNPNADNNKNVITIEKLTVKDGNNMTVQNNVTITVTGTLTIEDGATCVNNGIVVCTGTINGEMTGSEAAITSGNTTTYYGKFTDAVAAAEDGDTITLCDDIELTSTLAPTANVVIDGQDLYAIDGSASNGDDGISLAGNVNLTLKNLTMTTFTTSNSGCVFAPTGYSGTLTATNCTFEDFNKYGICFNTGTLIMKNCTVDASYETDASRASNCVQVSRGATANITDCTFTNSETNTEKWESTGINFTAGGMPTTITGNTFKNCDVAVYFDDYWDSYLSWTGDSAYPSDEVLENLIDDNTFAETNAHDIITTVVPEGTAYILQEAESGKVAMAQFYHPDFDDSVVCYYKVDYNTNALDCFTSLKDALDSTENFTTYIVASGESVTLNEDVTLPAGETLIVMENATLTNSGTIIMKKDATIVNGSVSAVTVNFNGDDITVAADKTYKATITESEAADKVDTAVSGTVDIDPTDETAVAGKKDDINTAADNLTKLDSDILASDDAHVETVNKVDALFEAANSTVADGALETGSEGAKTEIADTDQKIDTDAGVEVSGLALSVYGGKTDELEDNKTTTVYVAVTEKAEDNADALVDDHKIDNTTAIVLDIKPMEKVGEADATPIDNSALQTPVTFTIPLSANFEGTHADVYHITKTNGTKLYKGVPVQTKDGNKYITLTVTEFSNFVISPYTYVNNTPATYKSTLAATENGTATLSATKSQLNKVVTVTVKADAGYDVADVVVTYASGREVAVTDNGDGTYSYKQPGASVTVTVTFAGEKTWYTDALAWATENSIVADDFAMNADCTRADAVTYIWKAMGSPKVTIENPFTDISASDSYYEAILWAYDTGITTGVTDTEFMPNMVCNRSQIVTFLWRNAGMTAAETEVTFEDTTAGAWDYAAIQWAVGATITEGTGNNQFSGTVDCSAMEIVTFLFRQVTA